MSSGTISLSRRAFSEEDMKQLQTLAEKYGVGQSLFCAIVVRDVLASEDLTSTYVQKTRQFEQDQRPASIEEMRLLREQMRTLQEEVDYLRMFKREQESALNGLH